MEHETAYDPLVGQPIDSYWIEALQGRDALGRIYRGRDVNLDRAVLVRVLDAAAGADPDDVRRVERVARAVAQFDHPRIVRVLGVGQVDDVPYVASQRLPAESLAAHLRAARERGQRIAPPQAMRVLRDVAEALDFAHQRGVVHRDLDPSHILVDGQGRAAVADFGLGLLTAQTTSLPGEGAQPYAAPEQVLAPGSATARSDVYALGMIAYELLAGNLPNGEDQAGEATLPGRGARTRPSGAPPQALTPAVRRVLLRAIDADPEERYGSAGAFVDALGRVLAEPAVAAPPPDAESTVVHTGADGWIRLPGAGETAEPPPASIAPPPAAITPPPLPLLDLDDGPSRSWFGSLPGFDGSLVAYTGLIAAILLACVGCLAAVFFAFGRDGGGNDEDRAALVETPTVGAAVEETSAPTATGNPGSGLPAGTPPPTSLAAFPLATATPLVVGVPGNATGVPTPTPAAQDASAQGAPALALLLAAQGGDSLFLVNISRDQSLPLGPLRLGDSVGSISGAEWGLDTLGPGECVTVWSDAAGAQGPNLSCRQVGTQITRDAAGRFWTAPFNVYYGDQQVGSCAEERCLLTLAAAQALSPG